MYTYVHTCRNKWNIFTVYGSTLHGGQCTACCKVHANFANESVWLMADNVLNEGQEVICGPLDGIKLHGEQCSSCIEV
jgi:hypothetical protein